MNILTHLHQARLNCQLELSELAARTAISPSVLMKIDQGRFAELPAGIYARSYVRSFAAEVGVDPVLAVQGLDHVLPVAADPFPVLREVTTPATRHWSLERWSLERWGLARWAAVATDAVILLVLDTMLIGVVALCSGIAATVMLSEAAPALAAILTVPVVAYFVFFAGIGGRTPGASLWRVPAPPHTRLTLNLILQRALAAFPGQTVQLTQTARSR